MPAGGIGDEIGNRIAADIVTTFTTEDLALPPAPNDVHARAKVRKISVIWTPVAGAESYNVYRATTQGGPYTIIAEGHVTDYATYFDNPLAADTTYFYVVRSVAAGRQSVDSNEASATTSGRRARRPRR